MKPFRRAFPLVVVAFAMVMPRPARAGDAAAAQALFEEGRTLMEAGRYAQACPKLEDSQRLDPGPGTEYNLALCYEKSGRTASAWAAYLEAATAFKATQRADWESKARAKAQGLAGNLSTVVVEARGAPTGLRVTRDGRDMVASELGVAIPLDPGAHEFQATAPSGAKWSERIELAAGEKKKVRIAFASTPSTAKATASSSAPSAAAERPAPPEGGGSKGTWGLVVGGVGAAGVALGAVAGLVAINRNNASKRDCPEDGPCRSPEALSANSAARDWATVSTVAFAAGGALLAIGVIRWVTAGPSSDAARVAERPRVRFDVTGVRGTF